MISSSMASTYTWIKFLENPQEFSENLVTGGRGGGGGEGRGGLTPGPLHPLKGPSL